MQLTKNAIGNLINRYKAVLKRCSLMNVFGSLAVAGMLVTGLAAPVQADIQVSGEEVVHTSWSGEALTLGTNGTSGAKKLINPVNGTQSGAIFLSSDVTINSGGELEVYNHVFEGTNSSTSRKLTVNSGGTFVLKYDSEKTVEQSDDSTTRPSGSFCFNASSIDIKSGATVTLDRNGSTVHWRQTSFASFQSGTSTGFTISGGTINNIGVNIAAFADYGSSKLEITGGTVTLGSTTGASSASPYDRAALLSSEKHSTNSHGLVISGSANVSVNPNQYAVFNASDIKINSTNALTVGSGGHLLMTGWLGGFSVTSDKTIQSAMESVSSSGSAEVSGSGISLATDAVLDVANGMTVTVGEANAFASSGTVNLLKAQSANSSGASDGAKFIFAASADSAGAFNVESGAQLEIGATDSAATVVMTGLKIDSGGSATVVSGELKLGDGSTADLTGTNFGTILVSGASASATVQSGFTLTNGSGSSEGKIEINDASGILNIAGTLANTKSGTIINSGTIKITDNGILTNSGTITSGTINVEGSGKLVAGAITLSDEATATNPKEIGATKMVLAGSGVIVASEMTVGSGGSLAVTALNLGSSDETPGLNVTTLTQSGEGVVNVYGNDGITLTDADALSAEKLNIDANVASDTSDAGVNTKKFVNQVDSKSGYTLAEVTNKGTIVNEGKLTIATLLNSDATYAKFASTGDSLIIGSDATAETSVIGSILVDGVGSDEVAAQVTAKNLTVKSRTAVNVTGASGVVVTGGILNVAKLNLDATTSAGTATSGLSTKKLTQSDSGIVFVTDTNGISISSADTIDVESFVIGTVDTDSSDAGVHVAKLTNSTTDEDGLTIKSVTVNSGGELSNAQNGVLTVSSGLTVNKSGTVTNSGTFTVTTMSVAKSGDVNNTGKMTVTGLSNLGKFSNTDGSLTLKGVNSTTDLLIDGTGSATSAGTLAAKTLLVTESEAALNVTGSAKVSGGVLGVSALNLGTAPETTTSTPGLNVSTLVQTDGSINVTGEDGVSISAGTLTVTNVTISEEITPDQSDTAGLVTQKLTQSESGIVNITEAIKVKDDTVTNNSLVFDQLNIMPSASVASAKTAGINTSKFVNATSKQTYTISSVENAGEIDNQGKLVIAQITNTASGKVHSSGESLTIGDGTEGATPSSTIAIKVDGTGSAAAGEIAAKDLTVAENAVLNVTGASGVAVSAGKLTADAITLLAKAPSATGTSAGINTVLLTQTGEGVVNITGASGLTVASGATFSAATLTVVGEDFDFDEGEAGVNTRAFTNQKSGLSLSTLFNSGTVTNDANATLTVATLTNTGTVTNNGTLTVTTALTNEKGMLGGTGSLVLSGATATAQTLTVDGVGGSATAAGEILTASLEIAGSATLNVEGDAKVTGGQLVTTAIAIGTATAGLGAETFTQSGDGIVAVTGSGITIADADSFSIERLEVTGTVDPTKLTDGGVYTKVLTNNATGYTLAELSVQNGGTVNNSGTMTVGALTVADSGKVNSTGNLLTLGDGENAGISSVKTLTVNGTGTGAANGEVKAKSVAVAEKATVNVTGASGVTVSNGSLTTAVLNLVATAPTASATTEGLNTSKLTQSSTGIVSVTGDEGLTLESGASFSATQLNIVESDFDFEDATAGVNTKKFTNKSILTLTKIVNAGTLVNDTDAALTLTAASGLVNNKGAVITNEGTLTVNSGLVNSAGASVTNNGTMTVTGLTNEGKFEGAGDLSLKGANTTVSLTVDGVGEGAEADGEMRIANLTLDSAAKINVTGTDGVSVTGGKLVTKILTLDSTATTSGVNAAKLTQSGDGIVAVTSGALTVSDVESFDVESLHVVASVNADSLEEGGVYTTAFTNNAEGMEFATLANEGTVTNNGIMTIGVLTNADTARVVSTGELTLGDGQTEGVSEINKILVDGNGSKTQANGQLSAKDLKIAANTTVNVADSVTVSSGTLTADAINLGTIGEETAAGLNTPTLTQSGSGVVRVTGENGLTVGEGASLAATAVNLAGEVASTAGVNATKLTLNNAEGINSGSGLSNVTVAEGGSLINNTSATVAGLTMTGGSVENSAEGDLTLAGTVSLNGEVTNAGSMEIAKAATFSMGENGTLENTGTLTNNASATLGSGYTQSEGSLVNAGTLSVEGASITGGDITNTAGTLTLGAEGDTITVANLSVTGGEVKTGAEAIEITSSLTADEGILTIAGGTLTLGDKASLTNADYTESTGISITAGSLVMAYADVVDAETGSLVEGIGRISVADGANITLNLAEGEDPVSYDTYVTVKSALFADGSEGELILDYNLGSITIGAYAADQSLQPENYVVLANADDAAVTTNVAVASVVANGEATALTIEEANVTLKGDSDGVLTAGNVVINGSGTLTLDDSAILGDAEEGEVRTAADATVAGNVTASGAAKLVSKASGENKNIIAGNVDMASGTVTVSAGILEVQGEDGVNASVISVDGTLNVSGKVAATDLNVSGTLNALGEDGVNASVISVDGTLNAAGDVVAATSVSVGDEGALSAASLTTSGTITSTGSLAITGTVTAADSVSVKNLTAQNLVANSDVSFAEEGSVALTSGKSTVAGLLSNAAELTLGGELEASGGLENAGSLEVSEGAALTIATSFENTGTIVNSGTITNTISGDSSMEIGSGYTQTGELINAEGANLTLAETLTDLGGTLTNSGTVTNKADLTSATVALNNAGTLANEGTLAVDSVTNTGTIENTGTLIANESATALPGTVNNAGTLQNKSTAGLTLGEGFTNTGEIKNTGSLIIASSLSDLAGSIENASAATLTNQADLTSATVAITNIGTLNNEGKLVLDGESITNSGTIANKAGAELTLNASEVTGTITNEASATVINAGTLAFADDAKLDNFGILKNEGSITVGAENLVFEEGSSLNNTGSLVFNSGTTSLPDNFTNTGEVAVESGAILQVSKDQYAATMSGYVNLSSGTLEVTGTDAVALNLSNFVNGSVEGEETAGKIGFGAAGDTVKASSMTLSGNLNAANANLEAADVTGEATITAGSLTVTASSKDALTVAGADGSVTFAGEEGTIGGLNVTAGKALIQSGTWALDSGASLSVAESGVLTVSSTLDAKDGTIVNGAEGAFSIATDAKVTADFDNMVMSGDSGYVINTGENGIQNKIANSGTLTLSADSATEVYISEWNAMKATLLTEDTVSVGLLDHDTTITLKGDEGGNAEEEVRDNGYVDGDVSTSAAQTSESAAAVTVGSTGGAYSINSIRVANESGTETTSVTIGESGSETSYTLVGDADGNLISPDNGTVDSVTVADGNELNLGSTSAATGSGSTEADIALGSGSSLNAANGVYSVGSITGTSGTVKASDEGTLEADSIGESGAAVANVTASGGDVTSTGGVYAVNLSATSGTVEGSSIDATSAIVGEGGTLKATSGDVTVGTVTGSGSVEASGGKVAAEGDINVGSVTASNGISTQSGSIVASSGDIDAGSGEISSTQGSVTAASGSIKSTGITSSGSITAANGSIDAGSGAITVSGDSAKITASGSVKAASITSTGTGININAGADTENGGYKALESVETTGNITLASGGSIASKTVVAGGDISAANITGAVVPTGETDDDGNPVMEATKAESVTANNITATAIAAETVAATGTIEATQVQATNLSAATVKADAVEVEESLTADAVEVTASGIVSIVGTDSAPATATIRTLNAGTGSTFFVDPAYVKIDSTGSGAFDAKMLVGRGSTVAIGIDDADEATMREIMTEAEFSVGDNFTVGSAESVLALAQPITLGSGGLIVVDARVNSSGTLNVYDASGTVTGTEAIPSVTVSGTEHTTTAYFGNGSLLIVDGQALNGSAAITAASGTDAAIVTSGAKVRVMNSTDGSTITLLDGFYTVVNESGSTSGIGWANDDSVSQDDRMMSSVVDVSEAGVVTITNTSKTAAEAFPGLSTELQSVVNKMYADKANDVDSPYGGVRFLSRAASSSYVANGAQGTKVVESAARIAVLAGVPQMTFAANEAAANAVTQRTSIARPNNLLQSVNEKGAATGDGYTNGFGMWIMPLYQSYNAFGMEGSNSRDLDMNGNLGGVALGADYTFDDMFRVGLTFNIGGGYSSGSGDFLDTDNRFNFWGIGAYFGWSQAIDESSQFSLTGDVNYTSVFNDIEQNDAGLQMGKLKTDMYSYAISAGLRADYKVILDAVDITPHVGARYTYLHTDEYSVKAGGRKVLKGDEMGQSIWSFPIGVTFSKDFALESGWYVKPLLDLNITPRAGEIKANSEVRFTGVGQKAEIETQTMDYLTYGGTVGLEFGTDNIKLGVNYNLQMGAQSTSHGVNATFRYEF